MNFQAFALRDITCLSGKAASVCEKMTFLVTFVFALERTLAFKQGLP